MSADWHDLTAGIAAVAFVMAAFYLLFLPRRKRFSRHALIAWGVVGLFAAALLWSMWSETLRPLVWAGEAVRALRTTVGLAVLVLAVLLITYGGFSVVSEILKTIGDETVIQNIEVIRAGTKRFPRQSIRAARRANLIALLRAARPGCLWMALAFALLALGGWLGR